MQDYFSKMQGMKGGAAPQPAQEPMAGPMPGPMPGPMGPMPAEMPQQPQGIDISKAGGPGKNIAMIEGKIISALKEQGYYDLPENKEKGAEIIAQVKELARAIVEGDDEKVKASPIFKFILQKGGQRDVLREQVPQEV